MRAGTMKIRNMGPWHAQHRECASARPPGGPCICPQAEARPQLGCQGPILLSTSALGPAPVCKHVVLAIQHRQFPLSATCSVALAICDGLALPPR